MRDRHCDKPEETAISGQVCPEIRRQSFGCITIHSLWNHRRDSGLFSGSKAGFSMALV